MNLTRIQTKKVMQAVDAAVKKMREAAAALETVLPLLPELERTTIPRVRADFPDAARQLAATSKDHPEIVAATEYDAEAVVEDLDNVDALKPLDAALRDGDRIVLLSPVTQGECAMRCGAGAHASQRLRRL